MKKIFIIIILLFVINLFSNCQESKLDQILTQTDCILKSESYRLQSSSASATLMVVKYSYKEQNSYFLMVKKPQINGAYNTTSFFEASIEEEDLSKCRIALKTILNQAMTDEINGVEFIENKYITTDKFAIGYYILKGKIKWFMANTISGKKFSLEFKNVAEIEIILQQAQIKIEELKLL